MSIQHHVQCSSQAECWGCPFSYISSSRKVSTGHAGMQGSAPSGKQGDWAKTGDHKLHRERETQQSQEYTLANLLLTHHLSNNLNKWVNLLKIKRSWKFFSVQILFDSSSPERAGGGWGGGEVQRSHYSSAAFLMVGCWNSGVAGCEVRLMKPSDLSGTGGNVGRSTEVISCSSHSSTRELTTKHTLLSHKRSPPLPSQSVQRGTGKKDRDRKANIRLHENQVVEQMEKSEGRGGERWEEDETGARGVCFSRNGQAAIGNRWAWGGNFVRVWVEIQPEELQIQKWDWSCGLPWQALLLHGKPCRYLSKPCPNLPKTLLKRILVKGHFRLSPEIPSLRKEEKVFPVH